MENNQSLDSYLEKGKIFLAQENYLEAIKTYQEALSLYPDHGTIYRNLGFAQEKIGDIDGEIISYQKAIEFDPQQPEWVYTTLGFLLKEKQRLKDIINIYQIAQKIFPQQEFFVTEIKSLQETLNNTTTPEFYLKIGRQLFRAEKYDQAIKNYQEAIEKHPLEAGLYSELGVVQEKIGDFEGQLKSYQKALELDINQPIWLYMVVGKLLRENEQLEAAINVYQQAIKLFPENANLYQELGMTQEKIGDILGEINSYQKAIELNPSQPVWVYTTLGHLYQKEEQWSAAIAIYEEAINLYPKDFWPYLGLGDLYKENKQEEKARDFYQIGFKIAEQKNIIPYIKIIRLSIETQEYLAARKLLKEAEELFGENNDLLSLSAELYMQLGELSEANYTFKKLREKQINLPKWSYFEYIKCLFQLGKNEEIEELLKEIKAFNQEYYYEAKIFVENLGKEYYDNTQHHFNLETKLSNLEVLIERNQLEEAQIILTEIINEGLTQQIPKTYQNLLKQKSIKIAIEPEEGAEKKNPTTVSKIKRKKVTKSQAKKAALTIISKNYLSLARVLAESFLKYHPEAEFFVVLVDRIDDYFEPENEFYQVISWEELPLPNRQFLPYWYTILELNTAIKPFALEYIFQQHESIDNLLYIDPDIQIFGELTEIWQQLATNSVVLTPHMRKPFYDDLEPQELQILQSGAYNLGFLGLRRSQQSQQLLKWWQERLYLDCVVDLSRGLFTDQKWIDLVPCYFSETAIIRSPSYNVAYWNIHERKVEINDRGEYIVEGDRLRFFHFSGYSPQQRNKLSKHQNRHNIRYLPIIKQLCDQYADKLLEQGYLETSQWPYGFTVFGNNIKVSKQIIWVIRECIEKNISFPDLNENPEEFCQFLFTPNPYFTGYEIPPIFAAILTKKPDLKNTFPNAFYHGNDPDFISWLTGNGKEEFDIAYLVDNYIHYAQKEHPLRKIFNIYEQRQDVQQDFPQFWTNRKKLANFQEWLINHGIKEEGLSIKDINLFFSSYCFKKILFFYYQQPDLQKAFCRLHELNVLDDFTNWLYKNIRTLPNITYENIIWFNFIAQKETQLLLKINFIYNGYLKNICGDFSLFSLDARSKVLNIKDQEILAEICTLALDPHIYPLRDHLQVVAQENRIQRHILRSESYNLKKSLENLLENLTFSSDIYQEIQQAGLTHQEQLAELLANCSVENPKQSAEMLISLAGNFSAITGMGQSVRSMAQTIKAANLNYQCFDVPNTFIEENNQNDLTDPWLMGWYYPQADLSISVMNADSYSFLQKIIPSSYWSAKKNIGYWIWETDKLPVQWASSAMAFDEIWTASQYSAEAISKTITKPVRVIPHVVDFETIEQIISEAPKQDILRQKFGLPEKGFLFGFFFDPKSYLERKNPAAVIKAFETAFSEINDTYLILKINGKVSSYEYELLKSKITNPRIILIEESLSYPEVIQLMYCLDCYVSLHRAEGFGLTLAEAMALGRPTIATGYSGNLEFMNSDNSLLVDYELIQTDRPYGSYPQGTMWAEPNIEQAAKFMLELYNKPAYYTEIANKGRQSIYEQLSPQRVSMILKDYLELCLGKDFNGDQVSKKQGRSFEVVNIELHSSQDFSDILWGGKIESPNFQAPETVEDVIIAGWLWAKEEKEVYLLMEGKDLTKVIPCNIPRNDLHQDFEETNQNPECGFHFHWNYPGVFKIYFVLENKKYLWAEILISDNLNQELEPENLIIKGIKTWEKFIYNKIEEITVTEIKNLESFTIENLDKYIYKQPQFVLWDVEKVREVESFNREEQVFLESFLTQIIKPDIGSYLTETVIRDGFCSILNPFGEGEAKCNESFHILGDINALRFISPHGETFFIMQWPTSADCIYFPTRNFIFTRHHVFPRNICQFVRHLGGKFTDVMNYVSNSSQHQFGGILASFPRPSHFYYDICLGLYFLYKNNQINQVPSIYLRKYAEYFPVQTLFNASNCEYINSLKDIDLKARQEQKFYLHIGGHGYYIPHQMYLQELDAMIVAKAPQLIDTETKTEVELASQCYPLVWFGITGQKRAWVEQVEGGVKIITELAKLYPSLGVVFDGWTFPLEPVEIDFTESAKDQAVVDSIIQLLPEQIKVFNVVGATTVRKLAFAKVIDVFIANYSTGSLHVDRFAKKQGVGHLSQVFKIDNADFQVHYHTVTVPHEHIIDLPDPEKSGLDFVSYSIDPDVILNLVKEIVNENS